jgi:sugar lactone lactonase YvrE
MSHFEVVDPAGVELGEHPIWDAARDRVGWVDVFAGELRWVGGEGSDRWRLPAPLGAAALRRSGGVVAAAGDGIHFLDAAGCSDREPIAGFLPAGVRFNDAACDPLGNFVCGTVSLDGRPAQGSLYRLGPQGRIETLVSDVTESNGLAWSPDGATMYYVDSGEPVVRRYAYDAGLPPRRGTDLCAVADGRGIPDGLCVDAEGAVWVCLWEGAAVWRLSPDGELLDAIDVPVSRPTCPAFGGPGLARLFVASAWEGMDEAERRDEPLAGNLLAFDPAVPGSAVPAFAG